MYDKRNKLSSEVEKSKKYFKDKVLNVIPRNVRLSEAPHMGTSFNL